MIGSLTEMRSRNLPCVPGCLDYACLVASEVLPVQYLTCPSAELTWRYPFRFQIFPALIAILRERELPHVPY